MQQRNDPDARSDRISIDPALSAAYDRSAASATNQSWWSFFTPGCRFRRAHDPLRRAETLTAE